MFARVCRLGRVVFVEGSPGGRVVLVEGSPKDGRPRLSLRDASLLRRCYAFYIINHRQRFAFGLCS